MDECPSAVAGGLNLRTSFVPFKSDPTVNEILLRGSELAVVAQVPNVTLATANVGIPSSINVVSSPETVSPQHPER
jgi:hypothetical protein